MWFKNVRAYRLTTSFDYEPEALGDKLAQRAFTPCAKSQALSLGFVAPLGEESETYLIRIRSGGALVREEIATTPIWTYSAAAQSSDGVAGLYEVEVAQVSARFGPGLYALVPLPV